MNTSRLYALSGPAGSRCAALPGLRGNLLSLGARDDAGATPAMAWALEAMALGAGACWIEAGGNFKTCDLLRRLCVERYGERSVQLVSSSSLNPQNSGRAVFEDEWTMGSAAACELLLAVARRPVEVESVSLLSAACVGAWYRAGARGRGPLTSELIDALTLGSLREQAACAASPAHVRVAASSLLAKLDGSLFCHSECSSWARPFVSILTDWAREFNPSVHGAANVPMKALGASKSRLLIVVLSEEKADANNERLSGLVVMLARTHSRLNAAQVKPAAAPAIVLSGASTPLGWGILPCCEHDWGADWAMEHSSVGGWLSGCRGDPLRVAQMCKSWIIGSAQMGGLVESGVLHGEKNFEELASKWRSDVEGDSIEECLGPASDRPARIHSKSL